MTHKFDGHANCFIETGDGKAMLIDFNYDTEPLPASSPTAPSGPMGLLKESHLNHIGKLGFRWVYWNMLMPGRPLPDPQPDVPVGQAHRPRRGQVVRTTHRGEKEMPTTTINGREVAVDDEGFMTEYDQWDEDMGTALAEAIGVEMTDEHWKAIRFLRDDFKAQGETPTIRRVSTAGGIDTKQLFVLFPKKPAKKMAYIAGLPKPHGCV